MILDLAAYLPKYRSRSVTPLPLSKSNTSFLNNFVSLNTINTIPSSSHCTTSIVNDVKLSPRHLRSRNLSKKHDYLLTDELFITKQHRGKTIRVKMKNILSPSDKLKYTTTVTTQNKINSNLKQIESCIHKRRRKHKFNNQKRKNFSNLKAMEVLTEPATSSIINLASNCYLQQKNIKRKSTVENRKLRCSRRLQGQQPRPYSSSPESKNHLSYNCTDINLNKSV